MSQMRAPHAFEIAAGARIGAVERLRRMPAVFRGADLSSLQRMPDGQRRLFLHRAAMKGYVRPLGGKSDVYINRVVAPNWTDFLPQAVAKAYPSAIRVGQAAIHAGEGWTTQFAGGHLEIAVVARGLGARAGAADSEGALTNLVGVTERPEEWFEAVARGSGKARLVGAEAPLRTLKPGWALVDAVLWDIAPDPDDLDFDAIGQAGARQVLAAWKALAPLRGVSLADLPDADDVARFETWFREDVASCDLPKRKRSRGAVMR